MTPPRLCATVTAATMAELRERRDAVRDADLVELRLDSVRDPDVAGALQGRRLPVILTCRPAREGGLFSGSEDERRRLLEAAVLSDAEYVDLEWRGGLDDLAARRQGRGIILSMHDFERLPPDLGRRAEAMSRTGAEVVKLAASVSRLADNIPLLDVSRTLRHRQCVLIAMGEAGVVTRVCAARFGSVWTYAGGGVAPGQIPVSHVLREFHFRRVRRDTAVYGLVGRPVSHSLSPAMHNAGFGATGANAVYLPLAARDLADFAAFASAFDVAGASVTAPFKTDALELAAECSETARTIGAVNTLVRRRPGFAGTNTDPEGFLAALGDLPLAEARVAVLGHGGAARSVAYALRARGARVTMYGRDGGRARAVAGELGVGAAARPVPPASWDILVNATPVGTFPGVDQTPFPEARFDGRLVYDLVYNPPMTRLLREAGAAGCRTIGGLDMLVAQAQAQQAIWTGQAPERQVMLDAAAWKLSTDAGDA